MSRFSLLLVLALLFVSAVVATACGGGSSDSKTPSASSETPSIDGEGLLLSTADLPAGFQIDAASGDSFPPDPTKSVVGGASRAFETATKDWMINQLVTVYTSSTAAHKAYERNVKMEADLHAEAGLPYRVVGTANGVGGVSSVSSSVNIKGGSTCSVFFQRGTIAEYMTVSAPPGMLADNACAKIAATADRLAASALGEPVPTTTSSEPETSDAATTADAGTETTVDLARDAILPEQPYRCVTPFDKDHSSDISLVLDLPNNWQQRYASESGDSFIICGGSESMSKPGLASGTIRFSNPDGVSQVTSIRGTFGRDHDSGTTNTGRVKLEILAGGETVCVFDTNAAGRAVPFRCSEFPPGVSQSDVSLRFSVANDAEYGVFVGVGRLELSGLANGWAGSSEVTLMAADTGTAAAVSNSAGIPAQCLDVAVASGDSSWALVRFKYPLPSDCSGGDGILLMRFDGRDWVSYDSWSSPSIETCQRLEADMGSATYEAFRQLTSCEAIGA